jgi:hypothetical protein
MAVGSTGENNMIQKTLAIVVTLSIFGGCAEQMQATQAMSDEQRCINAGGQWRANSFCEQPGGGRSGRR